MGKAPAPGIERNIVYPTIPQGRLENGLCILSVTDNRLPRVSVQLAVKAGYVCNPSENLALVPLAVDLIKEGTATRSSAEIADFMDRWAIDYQSDVSMEHSLLSVTALNDYLEPALELLSDVVLNPRFPDEEFRKVKIRWRSELMAQRSQPNFLAHERTYQILYPGHPYSKVNVTPEHLGKVERESLREVYRQFYLPQNAYLLFAGPVELSQAKDLAQHYFGGWKGRPVPSLTYPATEVLKSPVVCLIHRPGSAQSTIVVSGRALPKTHTDLIALKVANQVLGGGGTARLFLNLRENKGYTYGAYSRLQSYREEGLFWVEASVKTESTVESVSEILMELVQMGLSAPNKKELKRCQSELVGAFIRQMETPDSVGRLEINRQVHQLSQDFYREFIPRVSEVSQDQVVEISRRIFDPQRVAITVVADRELVELGLQELGELSIYDTQGNRM